MPIKLRSRLAHARATSCSHERVEDNSRPCRLSQENTFMDTNRLVGRMTLFRKSYEFIAESLQHSPLHLAYSTILIMLPNVDSFVHHALPRCATSCPYRHVRVSRENIAQWSSGVGDSSNVRHFCDRTIAPKGTRPASCAVGQMVEAFSLSGR